MSRLPRTTIALVIVTLVSCQRAPSLTTAPRRTLAARLGYAPLDRWRPLRPTKDATNNSTNDSANNPTNDATNGPTKGPTNGDGKDAHEPIALDALAALSARGDVHGVGAASLVTGELGRAAESLARAPQDRDVENDLAVLSLARGDVSDALERLDALLTPRAKSSSPSRSPGEPRAKSSSPSRSPVAPASPPNGRVMWNRALALQALELPLAAAQSFDAVAALREPGWGDEARQRSTALVAGWRDRVARTSTVVAAARSMVAGGLQPTDAQVHANPSLVRHYFYHAVRAAPSLQRLEALVPIARALDRELRGELLVPWLERQIVETQKSPSLRRELAPRFGRYVLMPSTPPAVPPEELAQFFSLLAGDDDLRLASLILFNRTSPAEMIDLRRLVARNGDPWWRAWLAEKEAQVAAERGDVDGAARRLESAIVECHAQRLDFRCASLEKQLALVEQDRHHTSAARRAALAAIASARSAGMVPLYLETSAVFLLGQVARFRNDFSLMRAYLAEGMLRLPDNCIAQRNAHLTLGIEDVFELDFDDAAHELAATPACDRSGALAAADLITSLFLAGYDTSAAATLHADLQAARPSLKPNERLTADVLEARLVIARDRDAALALLAPALALPRTVADADAKKARTFAYQLLAVDAGRRRDFAAAVSALAAEAGTTRAQPCVLGVAIDDARVVVAARDRDDRVLGDYQASRAGPEIDAAHLVPENVRVALAQCPEVAVYALAPVHGQPDLLPPSLAWSYRVAHDDAATASAATAQRITIAAVQNDALATGRNTIVAVQNDALATRRNTIEAVQNGPMATTRTAPRRVIISDVLPPPSLRLAPLFPWGAHADGATWLSGAAATPRRALAAIDRADEIEFNAHGLLDLELSDTWLLALSPDADGNFALTAAAIAKQPLTPHPLVVLAACYAGRNAPYLHQPWSLPMAFIAAGARAVFASAEAIPDASAGPFFDAVLARVHRGEPAAEALRDERMARLRDDADSWTRHILLFQ